MPTKQSEQDKQKLLELFSNLTQQDLLFLQRYLDESEFLDEANKVIHDLLEHDEEEPWKVKVKKAILIVDKTDPKELIDLYVTVDEMKKLCALFGSNRATFALRIKGVG